MRIFPPRFIPFPLSRPTLRFPPNLPLSSFPRIPPLSLSWCAEGKWRVGRRFWGTTPEFFLFALLLPLFFRQNKLDSFSTSLTPLHFPFSVFYTSDRHTWAKGSEDFVLFLLEIKVMFQKIWKGEENMFSSESVLKITFCVYHLWWNFVPLDCQIILLPPAKERWEKTHLEKEV